MSSPSSPSQPPNSPLHPRVPAPTGPVPTHGSHRLRVRYCECDPMGVVHHAAYIPWLEMGRTELLRDAGVSYADLEAAGVLLVIVKLEVSYKRPAFYDDVLEVRTRVVGPASRVKIRHEYEIVRASDEASAGGGPVLRTGSVSDHPDQFAQASRPVRRTGPPGELLLTGQSLLACVDPSGKPAGLPEWLMVGE